MIALFVIGDSFRASPTPLIVLMLAGFGIGTFGYLAGSRFIVAIGVAMIFAATLLIPLVLNIYR